MPSAHLQDGFTQGMQDGLNGFHGTRNRGTDTAHERTAVKSSQNLIQEMATNVVMEQAMKDKFTMAGIQEAVQTCVHDEAKAQKFEDEIDSDDDADDDIYAMRRKRMEELKRKKEKREEWKAQGHGELEEIVESDFLKRVTKAQNCVCFFYHREFETCKVMRMHLRKCAKKLFSCKFIELNAEKAPFFVEKLHVKTLPTLVLFENGVAKHSMCGFDEVGGSAEFQTVSLARAFYMHEVCEEAVDSDDEF